MQRCELEQHVLTALHRENTFFDQVSRLVDRLDTYPFGPGNGRRNNGVPGRKDTRRRIPC
jgi:hypothetical protein